MDCLHYASLCGRASVLISCFLYGARDGMQGMAAMSDCNACKPKLRQCDCQSVLVFGPVPACCVKHETIIFHNTYDWGNSPCLMQEFSSSSTWQQQLLACGLLLLCCITAWSKYNSLLQSADSCLNSRVHLPGAYAQLQLPGR